MEERFKSKIIVDLWLENNGKILMLLRQGTGHYDGQYDLPGGHLEKGEDIFEAMIREAKEEIGIDIERENLEILHIYHKAKRDTMKFIMKVKKYSGKITNEEPECCKYFKWIDKNELPDNIVPTIKKEIININNGVYYDSDIIPE